MEIISNDESSTCRAAALKELSPFLPEITTISPPKDINSEASQLDKLEDGPEMSTSTQYVSGLKLVVVVASVAMACFLMLVDTMVISTAIPRITDQFKSLADVGWYASVYQFGSAAPQPLTGKVYTHFNSKWSFLTFFGIFELGSVLCGAAISSNMLIVGRTVAGFGSAGIINGAITIVSSFVPLEKRPALIGLTIGCFYINIPIGAFTALAIGFLRIPEQTEKARATSILPKLHHYLDLLGFALFAPAVLQLLLALQFGGNKYSWNSSQIIGLFCGAAATFVVWLLWNRHKEDDALLPHSMISRRTVWSAAIYQAFLMSAVYSATFFLPIYFQAINNANAMLSGVYLLPTILPQLFMAGSSGILLTKIGYVIPLAIFSTVLLSIASGLYSSLQPSSPVGWWIGFQILAGIGSGAGLQVAIIAIQAAVTGEELSSAMAFIVFTQSLGPAIVLVLCNLIFDESLKSQLPKHAPSVDAMAIMNAGATGFRKVVQPRDLAGVLVAYANSIDRVFYLVAAMASACGIALWGMGWQDIRNKNKIIKENDAKQE